MTSFSDMQDKIIPFFKKYPIRGTKLEDFEDFCKVAEMMEQNKHLTEEGLNRIREIKARMNRGIIIGKGGGNPPPREV